MKTLFGIIDRLLSIFNPRLKETKNTMKNTLIMRPRRASQYARRTQVQIPLALAYGSFFSGVFGVTSETHNEWRRFVNAHARGRLNTVKLEVPEIANMIDPVLRFTKHENGTVSYEAIDGLTTRGQDITRKLLYGIGVNRSVTRRPNPTLWLQQVA